MAQGTVKWFDAERGVGSIVPEDGGAEVAVHQSGIDGGGRQSLRAGERVTFVVDESSTGARAAKVYTNEP